MSDKTRIYVIMCNDYPQGATTKGFKEADQLLTRLRAKHCDRLRQGRGENVHSGYWRIYTFDDEG